MFSIEEHMISWLSDNVVACYGYPPETRPDTFLTVERTGGERERGIDRPELAVQAWAPTAPDAEELALKTADALIYEYAQDAHIRKISINGMYRFPDPQSKGSRYQLVIDLVTTI